MKYLVILFGLLFIHSNYIKIIVSKNVECDNIRINELNSDNPSVDEQLEFIELKIFGVCNTLARWRIQLSMMFIISIITVGINEKHI